MRVKVEAVTKELRHTQGSNVAYTGVMIGEDQWINIYGDLRNKKGQFIEITEPEIFGKNKWAKLMTKKEPAPETGQSPPPETEDFPPAEEPHHEPETRIPGQKTVKDYIHVLGIMYQAVKPLEPSDANARASLINTAMISWSNGKIEL